MRRRTKAGVLGVVGLSLSLMQASAVDLVLGTAYTGATPSGGGSVKVSLTQVGADVQVAITANLNAASEFVSEVWLNYSGTSTLTFSALSGPAELAKNSPTFKRDLINGTGPTQPFDISIEFKSSNSDGLARLQSGETVSLLISGTDLTVAQFANSLSGGSPSVPAAAHVQGIAGPIGSGKLTVVPEPSTYIAGALLLLPVLAQIRRVKRTA